ncbi:hypothetical protein CCUS01_08213, partial [Colletotrichum cuscutae]
KGGRQGAGVAPIWRRGRPACLCCLCLSLRLSTVLVVAEHWCIPYSLCNQRGYKARLGSAMLAIGIGPKPRGGCHP